MASESYRVSDIKEQFANIVLFKLRLGSIDEIDRSGDLGPIEPDNFLTRAKKGSLH